MNWDAIAAVAEILAALAVVFSLLYLARQLNHARHAIFLESRDTYFQDWHMMTFPLASDRSMAELWHRGLHDHSSLDEIDQERFRILMAQRTL